MTHLRTYERQIDDTIVQYLIGALKYPEAIRRLQTFHLSLTEAKEELERAVEEDE